MHPEHYWPDTFERLTPQAQAVARVLLNMRNERQALAESIDRLAPRLRELGASWAQVAWCVGQTTVHAQRRWGRPQ